MSKVTTKQREAQRIQRKAVKRADFIGRNYVLVLILRWIGYPAAALLSGITEFWSFYGRGQGIVVAIVLTLIIEAAVYWFGKEAIDDIQDGTYNGDGRDRALFVLKLAGFVGFFIFSITRSLDGGPILAEHLKEQWDPVSIQLLDEATIDEKYAGQRAEQTKLINDGRSMTWKGHITKEGWALINPATKKRNAIDALILEEKNELNAKNEATTLAYNNQVQQNSEMSIGIVGVGQLLFLFCVVIIGIYDSKIQEEVSVDVRSTPSGGGSPGVKAPTGGTYFRPAAPLAAAPPSDTTENVDPTATTAANPIGFGRYSHTPTPSPSVTTRSYTIDSPQAEAYLMAYTKAKSRISTEQRNLELKNGKPATVTRRKADFEQRAIAYQQELQGMGLRVILDDNHRYVLQPIRP